MTLLRTNLMKLTTDEQRRAATTKRTAGKRREYKIVYELGSKNHVIHLHAANPAVAILWTFDYIRSSTSFTGVNLYERSHQARGLTKLKAYEPSGEKVIFINIYYRPRSRK